MVVNVITQKWNIARLNKKYNFFYKTLLYKQLYITTSIHYYECQT